MKQLKKEKAVTYATAFPRFWEELVFEKTSGRKSFLYFLFFKMWYK